MKGFCAEIDFVGYYSPLSRIMRERYVINGMAALKTINGGRVRKLCLNERTMSKTTGKTQRVAENEQFISQQAPYTVCRLLTRYLEDSTGESTFSWHLIDVRS